MDSYFALWNRAYKGCPVEPDVRGLGFGMAEGWPLGGVAGAGSVAGAVAGVFACDLRCSVETV